MPDGLRQSMRLFLGIDIPEEIKTEIDHFLRPLQKSQKGWENPHDYHQTLLFIGETPDRVAEEIKLRLKQFSFAPFKLCLDKFYFFNRRIMYLGFKPSSELLKLKKLIDESFPEWVKPESKPFIPHITVKRWQRYEYDDLASGLATREFPSREFIVSSIVLFKSEKDQEDKKYHVFHRKFF